TRVVSLPSLAQEAVILPDGQQFEFTGWREIVETKEHVLARFKSAYCDASPAVIRSDRTTYLAMVPRNELLQAIVGEVLNWAGINATPCDPDLRITQRGSTCYAFNFSDVSKPLPVGRARQILLGSDPVNPRDITVWQENAAPHNSA
ncbi:beta-galactosidase trimerization domain-containing protein, partial [Ruegeria sp. NA]